MLIGAMNHPAEDLIAEIEWMAEMSLGFIDLTLEPPMASSWKAHPIEIRKALERHRLEAVGHTAYYLPIASPFENIRRAAVEELARCLEVFAAIGVKWMNIHPDGRAPLHPENFHVARNLQSLEELLPLSAKLGVGLMMENIPGRFNNAAQLAQLLDSLPELGLHLDIGHCNLMAEENTADELIAAFGDRLKHVHLHDNKGGSADLHLPLGCGTMKWEHYVKLLKRRGYDGTITLEVFTEDKSFLAHSRDLLRQSWDSAS